MFIYEVDCSFQRQWRLFIKIRKCPSEDMLEQYYCDEALQNDFSMISWKPYLVLLRTRYISEPLLSIDYYSIRWSWLHCPVGWYGIVLKCIVLILWYMTAVNISEVCLMKIDFCWFLLAQFLFFLLLPVIIGIWGLNSLKCHDLWLFLFVCFFPPVF